MTVTDVVPVTLTDGDITGILNSNRTYCRGQLEQTELHAQTLNVTADDGNTDGSGTVALPAGLKLKENTTNECQGMHFNVKWKVTVVTNFGN